MLKLSSLSKKFGNFTAVNSINLNIEKGELFGFLGPNGAGKTTTIKMIVGLYTPTSGSIHLDKINGVDNHLATKKILGYVPDQPFLYDKLTGLEFLQFSAGLYSIDRKTARSKIEYLIDLLKIGDWINKRTEEYSQGMRQRITIASALLHDPKIIVIDEPMVGLDPQSAHIIKSVFKQKCSEGTTIFMSTHSLNVVEEICTHVGIINYGQIIFDDNIKKLEELKLHHDQNIEELFIELTKDQ
jgi:ABC-2 type transport system ATP-binding protein